MRTTPYLALAACTVGALGAGAFSGLWAAAPEAESATQAGDVSDALRILKLQAGDLQPIDTVSIAHSGRVVVSLAGAPNQVRLYPYPLRSPTFSVLVQDESGALTAYDPPPPSTYRGRIVDDPGSSVSVSVVNGGLYGTIQTSWGETFIVEPSPLKGDSTQHIVYRQADVTPGDERCGVQRSLLARNALSVSPDPPPSAPFGVNERAEIAIDTDVEFFNQHTSVDATILDIEAILNDVGRIYQDEVGICYIVSTMIIRTAEPDPYGSSDGQTLLCDFRAEWNGGGYASRDVAHLFTGKEMTDPNSNPVGLAYIGVICGAFGPDAACSTGVGDRNYGWVESLYRENDPNSSSTPWANRVQTSAHELGHNWDACHCDLSGCTGGSADADCGLMNSFINGTTSFGSRSRTAVTNHRNSRLCLGDCLDPVYVDIESPGGNGTPESPFHTLELGMHSAQIDGTVIIGDGTYDEAPILSGKAMLLTATGGSAIIE